MEIGAVKKEVDKVKREIQDFASFDPGGEAEAIEYIHTARKVANCYDRIVASDSDEKTLNEINLLRHHLQDNPQYLDFH